jgi:hypothetical protein
MTVGRDTTVEEQEMDYVRARQKFHEAQYALTKVPNIDMGLTYAANYLVQLSAEDLPAEMRDEFEALRRALTTIPLSSATGYVARPLSDEKARELKQTIDEMYAELGGLW